MHNKAVEPLDPAAGAELERIVQLDVSGYNEMDVRAEIIDPLLRVLGYDIRTDFRPEREKRLFILGKLLKVDYNLTLWKQGLLAYRSETTTT